MFKKILKTLWLPLALSLVGGGILAGFAGKIQLNNVIMCMVQGDRLYSMESLEQEIIVYCSDFNGRDVRQAAMSKHENGVYRIAESISLEEDGTCVIHYQEYYEVAKIQRLTAVCNFEEGIMEDIRYSEAEQLMESNNVYKVGRDENGCLWYIGDDGSVWKQEDGESFRCIFKNDGTFITPFNWAYCLGKSGIYFYNRDSEEIYRIPYDAAPAEEGGFCPINTGMAEKWGMKKYGSIYGLEEMENGSFTAVFRQNDTRLLPAVIGQSDKVLPAVYGSQSYIAGVYLLSFLCLLAGSIVIYILYKGILFIFGNVLPTSLKAFFLAFLVMVAGAILLDMQIESILAGQLREQEKTRLYNDTDILARLIEEKEIFHGETDVFQEFITLLHDYYGKSMKQGNVYGADKKDMGKIAPSESNYDLFLDNGGEFYLVSKDMLNCMPSQAANGIEEASYMEACRETGEPVIFLSNRPGNGKILTLYAPVFDENGSVRGLVRGTAAENYIEKSIQPREKEIMTWILLFLIIILGIMTIYAVIGMAPLLRLRSWTEKQETEERKKIAGKGTGEVAQVIDFLVQMWNSISLHLKKVERLKSAYEPFIPQSFIRIFGKKDIRDMVPGEEQSMEAVILSVDSYEIKKELCESDLDEFYVRNRIYCIASDRIEEEGGITEHFARTGVTAVFQNGAEPSLKAAGKIVEDLTKGWKSGEEYFFGAGLIKGQMHFGIIGTEERMSVMSDSPAVAMSEKLSAVSCRYRTGILMTGKMKKIAEKKEIQEYTRLLAWVRLEQGGEPEEIYEYFAVLGEEQQRLRKETKQDFENGLACLRDREYSKGRDCFAKVLRNNKEDLAAERYFRICDRIMEGAEEPEEYLTLRSNPDERRSTAS